VVGIIWIGHFCVLALMPFEVLVSLIFLRMLSSVTTTLAIITL
jgi:hypothetical protein